MAYPIVAFVAVVVVAENSSTDVQMNEEDKGEDTDGMSNKVNVDTVHIARGRGERD